MKRPRVVAVLVLACLLLAYIMFIKHHYSLSSSSSSSSFKPSGYKPPPPHLSSHSRWSFQYGIMFDAGSTGTRVHIFKFQLNNGESPKLLHETFRSIKPGLSAYAEAPRNCSPGVEELLEVAKSSIPRSQWTSTPVVLKATAGLRLLTGAKAEELLDTVRALFRESPFLSRDDSVSIMDGTDEGISAWVTINFLTGGLQGPQASTVGMLDLGGGSTQITFSPHDKETIQTSPIGFIRSFQMFNNTHTVYTHSYLALGLMSARLAILGGVDAPPPGGSNELVSPCLAPEYSGHWYHAERSYAVRGQKAGEPAYEACRATVEKFLSRKVTKAPEVARVDFYAFSYYYDRAVDLGVIEEQQGGTIRVSDYLDSAKQVCGSLAARPPQSSFLCLDLVYISVLLQELGFPPHKQLKLARTINQVETSWALGATFHHFQNLRNLSV